MNHVNLACLLHTLHYFPLNFEKLTKRSIGLVTLRGRAEKLSSGRLVLEELASGLVVEDSGDVGVEDGGDCWADWLGVSGTFVVD